MKPGRELDDLVTKIIMGDIVDEDDWGPDGPKSWSTDGAAAWEAWEWLEENHPWIYLDRWGGQKADLLLGRKDGKPAVYVMRSYWDSSNMDGGVNLAIVGDTYPHAICLAILEIKEWIKL